MATHANTAQSMGIKCMKGGGDLPTSGAIHFRYWGWGTSRRILGVPGGSNSIHQYGEGQHMPTDPRASVQPYITGSRAVFSKILTKSHDILQVYEPEGPPCLSRTVKRGSNIEDRESRSGKRGSRILDRELRIENGELRIENRESRSEDRGSRIENGACQARSGKLMRMADRFRTEWKFQCSNTSCSFHK